MRPAAVAAAVHSTLATRSPGQPQPPSAPGESLPAGGTPLPGSTPALPPAAMVAPSASDTRAALLAAKPETADGANRASLDANAARSPAPAELPVTPRAEHLRAAARNDTLPAQVLDPRREAGIAPRVAEQIAAAVDRRAAVRTRSPRSRCR